MKHPAEHCKFGHKKDEAHLLRLEFCKMSVKKSLYFCGVTMLMYLFKQKET